MEEGPIAMSANLIGSNQESGRSLLLETQRSRSQQQVKTFLEELLPNRFVPHVLAQTRVPFDRKWNSLSRDERDRLLVALTQFSFGAVSEIPIDRGEVTAGGVSLSEVSPTTMMSRLIPSLFFAGEMLDVAGEIGGFNLQAAYSTGFVAGSEAVNHISERA